MNEDNYSSAKKISIRILVVVTVLVCMFTAGYAAVVLSDTVEDNYFHTGTVEINLNDGKPVITADEFLFEPGMTVVKDFFLENKSTWAVYYKLYFSNVEGALGDVLEISIYPKGEPENVLFSGVMSNMTRLKVRAAKDDALDIGEKMDLTIAFHYPEEAGNETQELELSFELCADAVQTKNNPEQQFE